MNTLNAMNTTTNLDVRTMVNVAAKSLAPVWPLKTFIACNALHGFESQNFDEALGAAQKLFQEEDLNYQEINRETIKWCGAYFDKGQSVIEMPKSASDFYATFKDLSKYDKKLHQNSKQNKQWLHSLPINAEDAIIQCLELLQVTDQESAEFLKKSFAQLPGWSGYIKYLAQWENTASNILVEFTAIRLIITVLLNPELNFTKITNSKIYKPQILDKIKKLEENYKSHLILPILHAAKHMHNVKTKAVDAQLVFCIDVRSEPFRRSLEATGPYETLGFAGFFGLPIRFHDYNSNKITDSCPVLLKSQYDIHDEPCSSDQCNARKHKQGNALINSLAELYQQLKYNFATPFALVETLGAWCGLLMLFKTFKPTITFSIINKLLAKIRPKVMTQPRLEPLTNVQVEYAETVLRMMGLIENFGKFVIFCGHGSSTQNNPYASGLDCGACGGNHGGDNAKVLAAILNQAVVRTALSERGIVIPQYTQFLAAEHNTTTDELCIFEDNIIQQQDVLNKLKIKLQDAKTKTTALRVMHFNMNSKVNSILETERRSQDWSEVRPEWGLARNAAFIIGPRNLTKDLDLEGRCFLHSYIWEQDASLSTLETILTAPMVVAEWINTQYLFSTIDNINYGSGSKVTHNVTGKIGVMQGNGSDLMHGLPLQSVNSTDAINYHQPQRLLTVIYAPRSNVSEIISRHQILQTLFFNKWVNVVVIEPKENKAYQLQTSGEWHDL